MTKHGHGLPRKRPNRSAKDEIADDLPELEPLDDLPTLEPITDAGDLPTLAPLDEEPEDDGPVKVAVADEVEQGFDTVFAVEVPAMDKPQVLGAVEGPLERGLARHRERLRHRRVLVRFAGEALIGTAVKDRVTALLEPHKPLLAVVRRGFGDEQVLAGTLPAVAAKVGERDGSLQVEIDTQGCDADDLAVALEPPMADVLGRGKGRRVVFQFQGGARPDNTLRDALAMALRDAGARSFAIGARVVFDRDLEERVVCSVSGNKVTIAITLSGDDAETVDALSLVLPRHAEDCRDRNLRFQFARESAAVQAFCVDFGKGAGARLIEVGGHDDFDIVWPPLVELVAGKEVVLRLVQNGRSRAAVLSALQREAADHHVATQGKQVVLDWPAGFALDAEAEKCLDGVLSKIAPKRLDCTVGGDQREPFVPDPLRHGVEGERHTIRLDTESGKPKDLQRAIDRRLPRIVAQLRGASVRLEVVGDVAMSRSSLKAICLAIAEAGAMRLEVAEAGSVDLLLPPMLAVIQNESGVRISAIVDSRDDGQQERAVRRELEGVELALQNVVIAPGAAAERIGRVALEMGAASVVLDGPTSVRMHPPLFEDVSVAGRDLRFVFDPTGDAGMDVRMLARELPERLKAAGLLAGKTVALAWPGATKEHAAIAQLLEGLRSKNVAKVLLERGEGDALQLHPEPKPEPAAKPPVAAPGAPVAAAVAASTPAPAPASAAPAAASAPAQAPTMSPGTPAMAAGGTVRLLGRRDEAIPPMVLLGVTAGDDDAHLATVEQELSAHLPRLRGRAVLLIPQQDGADLPVRRTTPFLQMLGRVVPGGAAATLVFRGPDAQGRPHFQVLHSTLRAMPVGATFGDPRAGR